MIRVESIHPYGCNRFLYLWFMSLYVQRPWMLSIDIEFADLTTVITFPYEQNVDIRLITITLFTLLLLFTWQIFLWMFAPKFYDYPVLILISIQYVLRLLNHYKVNCIVKMRILFKTKDYNKCKSQSKSSKKSYLTSCMAIFFFLVRNRLIWISICLLKRKCCPQ